jgi:type I restriction enzyme, S subunit
VSDLERIPSDWQKLPLKRVADVTNSGCYGDDDESDERSEPLKAITTAHIDPLAGFKTENASVRYFSQREKAKYLGRPGDIFVVKSSGSNENVITGKRAQIQDENDLVFTNFLLRVRANERSNPRFLHHLLGSSLVHSRIKREVATTTYPNLNLRQYLGEPLPLPDLATQRQIADFLDRETARIDLLIEKKQRLVALLGEKKDAELSRLERELFADTDKVSRLSYHVTKVGSGKTPSGGATVYQDAGILFLRSQNIKNNGVSLADAAYISEEIDVDMANSRVQPRDILLNITGASLGRCAIAPSDLKPANVNQHVCIIRPMKHLLPEYLHLLLLTPRMQGVIRAEAFSAGREGLNFESIRNFRIPVPESLMIQRDMANQISTISARDQRILATNEKSIDRLKEYRSALITAAVTGQIDVTTYAKSGTPDRRLDAIQEEMGA